MGGVDQKNVVDDVDAFVLFSFCSHDPRATAMHETLKQGKETSNIITAGEEEVAR